MRLYSSHKSIEEETIFLVKFKIQENWINRKVVEYNNQLSIDPSGESAGDRREAVRTRAQLAIKRLEK
ncbi:jg14159 [Pararge aegeria aegeria]|uniref:Jg14159 protein n=1 Tax=Pararge aegeria aegeria TaxID=348720 RepID=A0A8S4SLZ4_9NEOP|nr:jg14159 [Pararge aegeria aegeria]